MDGPVGVPSEDAQTTARSKSPHLICGSRLRAIATAAVCFYFSYSNYIDLRDRDFQWDHALWTIMTWAVWLVLVAGVFSETRCLRERFLCALVLANCALGLAFSAWSGAPFKTLHLARELTFVLWVLAFLASLSTFAQPRGSGPSPEHSQ